jgi:NTP pyrophosphatase (non-canonical NTP hydrolase)
LEKLYRLARGYNKRYPKGVEPFQIVARLLEECGEVASEVNLWEASGIKRLKRGEPRKEDLADEIKQALNALVQLAVYYKVEGELEVSIDRSLGAMKEQGLLD